MTLPPTANPAKGHGRVVEAPGALVRRAALLRRVAQQGELGHGAADVDLHREMQRGEAWTRAVLSLRTVIPVPTWILHSL